MYLPECALSRRLLQPHRMLLKKPPVTGQGQFLPLPAASSCAVAARAPGLSIFSGTGVRIPFRHLESGTSEDLVTEVPAVFPDPWNWASFALDPRATPGITSVIASFCRE